MIIPAIRKTKLGLSAILFIISALIIIIMLEGCDDDELPCVGPILYTSQSPTGTVCYAQCGAPTECDRTVVGGKGSGCDFGQICDDSCKCVWVDKDIDGYDIQTCVEGDENWMSLPEVDVIKGDYTWDLSTGVTANSFQLVQVKGTGITKIYKLDFYGDGFQKTYDYSSEPEGYYKLSSLKKLVISFETTTTITKIVVNWDDNDLGNVVKPIFYTKPGSSTCDCNDYNAYIHPQAAELCDNVDNDCDGVVDEDDVCEKNIYTCKTDSFIIENKGNGKNLSYGHCAEGEWCSNKIIGEQGSCTYTSKEKDGLGKKDFYAYVCDRYSCYKFTKGGFVICGHGWNCTAACVPGSCNYDTKEWCNDLGMWQTEGWCQSECGKTDSTCEGNCEHGRCDVNAKKWCKNGYWVEEGYCDCSICGSEDSTCSGCTCENGACDTEHNKYCKDGVWKSEDYCYTACCQKDYDCYIQDICETCTSGTCDITNNKYCLDGVWTSEDYCEHCECCDSDCGVEPCEDGTCDIIKKKYCDDGNWTALDYPIPYCYPGYCGTKDPSCACTNDKDGCCKGEDDDICDPDCTEEGDPDCKDKCTPKPNDCCKPLKDSICDTDCIPGLDPDCQECKIIHDDCCSDLDDDNCDPDCTEENDPDCEECTPKSGDCCDPSNDDVCDADCISGVDPDCASHPCTENWVCNKWDKTCDGINEEHTCLEWNDTNNCNTFYDKPDDTQPCYIEFPCRLEDDKDKDGYPWRACYDEKNGKVLEELDCDDNDASQNPNATEICNGEDDDCDDSKDEGCPCVGGATQECGKNVGVCRSGLQLCTGGYWGVCGGSGYVGPTNEVCDDGLDNNCDSYIDENCKCVEGQKQDCGSDIGVCKKGWQACYNGSFGSVCNDETKGVTEVCNNNLDDDCDSTLDGDDSNCQVTTPVTTGAEHCKNRIQDAGETGLDCGDNKDCPSCADKSPACDYGAIEEKCICGRAEYKTGYCCNGKYSLVECVEPAEDSDGDGCNEDKEFKLGTDPKSGDTDGDGKLDCDPSEQYPLCNEDGTCDAEKEYPETLENCPGDCGAKGVGWLTWLMLIIIVLGLFGVGLYLYAKSKGYKLSDFIKIKKKEKEEKPKFQFGTLRRIPQTTPEVAKLEKKRDIIRLREFANNAIKKGYTKLQVRQSALKAGWTEQEIDNVLKGKKSEYKFFK